MRTIKRLISISVFLELSLLFCLSLVTLNWAKPGEIIDSNDTIYPLRPISFFQERLYQWKHTIGSGVDFAYGSAGLTWHGIQALIAKTGVSIYTNQKIFLLLWFNLISYSFYFLILTLLPERKFRLARLAGTVFYCFNPYLFNLWGNIQSANLAVYFFLPFATACLLRALKPKQNLLFWPIMIGLGSIFASPMGMNPQIILSLFIYFSLLLIFLFIQEVVRSQKISPRNFFLPILLSLSAFFVMNLYWILPDLRAIIGSGLSLKVPGEEELRGWLGVLSLNTSALNVFRLQGEWTWYFTHRGEPYIPFAQTFQINPVLVTLSLLPIFLSVIVLIKSKNHFVPFFGLILFSGVFISMGIKPPFGYLYQLLAEKIKYFSFLRSPWYKFSVLTVLAYAVLIAFFGEWLITNKKKFAIFFLCLIILGQLIYGYPLLTGEAFPVNFKFLIPYRFSIPSYVWEAQRWLADDPEEAKIVVLPQQGDRDFYRWGYGASFQILNLLAHPKPILNDASWTVVEEKEAQQIVGSFYEGLFRSNSFEVAKILAPLNVKYLVQKNDFYDDFSRPLAGSPEFIAQRLNQQKFIKKVSQFGSWDIFEISREIRYPFIYPVEDLSVFAGGSTSISQAFLLNDRQNTGLVDQTGYLTLARKFGSDFFDRYLVTGQLLQRNPYLWPTFPFARFLPGDLFYPYIRSKEEKLFKSAPNSFERLRLSLFFASKRLGELEKMKEKKLLTPARAKDWQKVFDDYSANLVYFENNFSVIESQLSPSVVEWLQETAVVLTTQKEKLIHLYQFIDQENGKIKEISASLVLKLIGLQEKTASILESSVSSSEVKKFLLNLEEDGRYQVLLLNDFNLSKENQQNSGLMMKIGSKEYLPKLKVQESGWLDLGDLNFSKGEMVVELQIASEKLLLPSFEKDEWIKSNGAEVIKEEQETILSFDSAKATVSASLEVKGLDPGKSYLLSFEYQNHGFDFPRLIVSSKSDEEEIGGKINYKRDDRLEYFPKWQKTEKVLEPENAFGPTLITILLEKPSLPLEKGKLLVKNFKIVPLSAPTLILRKEGKSLLPKINQPKIEFTKINPAKYRIEVKNARDKFILVFSETYNSDWQVVFTKNEILAEENHLRINGFANAWLVDKTGDFQMTLEYSPQRSYVKYLAASGFFVGSSFLYCFFMLFKKRND